MFWPWKPSSAAYKTLVAPSQCTPKDTSDYNDLASHWGPISVYVYIHGMSVLQGVVARLSQWAAWCLHSIWCCHTSLMSTHNQNHNGGPNNVSQNYVCKDAMTVAENTTQRVYIRTYVCIYTLNDSRPSMAYVHERNSKKHQSFSCTWKVRIVSRDTQVDEN